MMRLACAVLAILGCGATRAGGLAVPPHEAVYHATVKMIPVRATVTLEEQGPDVVLYQSRIEPRGWAGFLSKELAESSLLSVDDDGKLQPISYRKLDGIGGRNSDIRFDAAGGEMRVKYKDRESRVPWEHTTYDLLSLRLVLSNDLARDRLADCYTVVDDKGQVEEVDVRVTGRQPLDTPEGELDTVRIEYVERDNDRLYRLWLAPALDGALVRLDQFEDGKLRGRLSLVEYRRTGR